MQKKSFFLLFRLAKIHLDLDPHPLKQMKKERKKTKGEKTKRKQKETKQNKRTIKFQFSISLKKIFFLSYLYPPLPFLCLSFPSLMLSILLLG